MKKEKLPILKWLLDICIVMFELIILIGFRLFDTMLIIFYSLVSIGLILLILYKKNKDRFMSFLSFCKEKFAALFGFFLLNIIWAGCLIYARRPGIEVGITLFILGLPVWLLNSFVFQPFFFKRLIKNSEWISRYLLYIALTPFIFRIFGDLGPSHIQRIGSVLLSIVIPMCFLLFAERALTRKNTHQISKKIQSFVKASKNAKNVKCNKIKRF